MLGGDAGSGLNPQAESRGIDSPHCIGHGASELHEILGPGVVELEGANLGKQLLKVADPPLAG